MTRPEWSRAAEVPRGKRGADVDDELRFHIEAAVRDLVAHGMAPDDARLAALARFGSVDDVRQACVTIDKRRDRKRRRGDFMTAFLHDVRYAFRAVRNAPALTLVIVATLALGIGANTAIFSVLDAVVLSPLPYPSADRLVAVRDMQNRTEETSGSYPEYVDWKRETSAIFERIGAYSTTELTLEENGDPVVLPAARMSADIPAILGAATVAGRSFKLDDEPPGSGRVVMISDRLWRDRFASDRSIIGRPLTFNGNPWTVVGVFKADHRARLPNQLNTSRPVDVWYPLRLDETRAPRGLHFINVLATLRPGLSLEAARARAQIQGAAIVRTGVTLHGIRLVPLAERTVGDVRALLRLLVGAVGLVLLIACANVANLLLGRAAAREREIAIRFAIGADRWRVATQLLTEAVVRACLGGVAGIGVAYVAIAGFKRYLPSRLPRFDEIGIDGRVLAFTVVVSVLTGLVFGTVPALRASRGDPVRGLKDGGRGTVGSLRRDRLRSGLIIGQVALSFVLLMGSGLLLRSLSQMLSRPKGFDASRLVTAFVSLPGARYPDSTATRLFFDRLLQSVRAVPGVEGVALTTNLPIEGGVNGDVNITGFSATPDNRPVAEKRVVSPSYFRTIGARVIKGRDFDERDRAGAEPVVIVNETFARRWLTTGDPVGRELDFGWETTGTQRVVGVIEDIREGELNAPATPAIYIPITQRSSSWAYIVLRTTVDPAVAIAATSKVLRSLDPKLPVSVVRTFDQIIDEGVGRQRLSTSLITVFAGLALLLAAVGLYSVVSFSVVQRTQELGVRAALGADRRDIMRLVLGQGIGIVTIGIIVGALASVGTTRLVRAQLFGVQPSDGITFVGVLTLLIVVSLVASAIPAMRAAKTDPLVALRRD